MRTNRLLPLAAVLVAVLPGMARGDASFAQLTVDPPSIRLVGPNAGYTLLITGKTADGRLVDLTQQAHYQSSDPHIAGVSEAGFVRGRADGAVEVSIEVAGRKLKVPVRSVAFST